MSVAELDLVKSVWPPEADMIDILAALPELEPRLEATFDPDAEMRFYPDDLGQLGTQRGWRGSPSRGGTGSSPGRATATKSRTTSTPAAASSSCWCACAP